MALTIAQEKVGTPVAGLRPKDISNEIFVHKPWRTKTLTMLQGQNKVKVGDVEFKMNEQEVDPNTVTVVTAPGDGGLSTSQIAVSADDSKHLGVGQSLTSGSGKTALITAVNTSTGVVTFAAAVNTFGFTAAVALVRGSRGFEELSDRPSAVTRQPTQVTNYVETLRDVTGVSTHNRVTRFYGGSRYRRNRELMMYEHKRSLNRGLIVNGGAETTQNSQALWKTHGLLSLANVITRDFSTPKVSFSSMLTAITTDARYMEADDLWFICAPAVRTLIELAVRADAVPTSYVEAGRLRIKTLEMGGKRIMLVEEDCLEGALAGYGFLCDPDALEIVTTADEETGERCFMQEYTIPREHQANGTDGELRELYSHFGLRINGRKRVATWYGMTELAS